MAAVKHEFGDGRRGEQSEQHAQVYGEVERAEELAHVRLAQVLVVFDELVHAERGDTRFYAAHADRDQNQTVQFHAAGKQTLILLRSDQTQYRYIVG